MAHFGARAEWCALARERNNVLRFHRIFKLPKGSLKLSLLRKSNKKKGRL